MTAVFIATPTYDGWVSFEYSASMLETGAYLALAGIGVLHGVAPGNPFLDTARNELVAQFLKSEATDLLFIDADVGWDAKMLTRVLCYPQEIVGGLVPKRHHTKDDDFHENALTGNMSPEGLFQTLELPTAFMRIKRSAFAKLRKPYFKIGPNVEVLLAGLRQAAAGELSVEGAQEILAKYSKDIDHGEDIHFCRRWCETGEFLWVDSDITFTHRGGKVWNGNFFDHCIATGKLKQKEAA